MKKVEIIQMVASHYSLGNRAIGREGECQYITHDGRMCAVGMCIKEDVVVDLRHEVMGVFELNEEYCLDGILKDKFRGHKLKFWSDLQMLHDGERFWTNEGLSNEGHIAVKELELKYSDDNT